MSRDLITKPITAALLHGAVELEHTAHGVIPHRLPAWARAQSGDPQLAMVEAQPSGVRLVFQTRATVVELQALRTRRVYAGLPARPDGVYVLAQGNHVLGQTTMPGGHVLTVDMAAGSATRVEGAPGHARFANLPEGDKTLTLWLPHDEAVELIALHSDAPLVPVEAGAQRRWVHHGSSISHGSNATAPHAIWPVVAAAQGDVALTNLGFGGSALLDPFVARTIRDLPADLISLKLGINLVNLDLMRLRALGPAVHGFLDTIRDGHPTTPLLLVSPILCPMHEATPGPTLPDTAALARGEWRLQAAGDPTDVPRGKLTLQVIRSTLAEIVAQRRAHDPNLHYLDGLALYGEADAQALPLPDGLHPDTATHRLIGERFAAHAFAEGVFGR
ncbi:GDSL-like Lipase/Acylhydrolase family protein [Pseudoxanthomonas sp. GM95]|uniref:SGNH/GDSL hydrolase family protein n=1 Tax=Pseudoxanthomonas sp. GM95 TaxID=1881043 RepID=UPI0008CEA92A|nr:SGNH/GDSL hydrolase family protein [Pseudoxanthomonas sp. GM95]SEK94635.1 GDSL-like Lipase/Acylhydrolase family protein [Pseudoxanthomonas sp. GM95]